MRRAIRVVADTDFSTSEVKGTVTLSFEDRFRRRVRLTDDDGEAFMLDLPQAARFEDGNGLALDSGGVLLVRAALEDVLDVTGLNTQHTARLAWHIGNRHTPVEVLPSGLLRLQYDHVLAHMLEGLGATLERKSAPFVPEPGAYDGQSSTHDDDTGGSTYGHAYSHHG